MPGEEFAIIMTVIAFGGTIVLAGMIIRAINRHLDRKHGVGAKGPSSEDVEGLRAAVHELREQVVQLEERVDFTERLLARAREAERLGP